MFIFSGLKQDTVQQIAYFGGQRGGARNIDWYYNLPVVLEVNFLNLWDVITNLA